MATITELLKADYERLKDIYKSYNTNEDNVKRDVEILKEWLKKQAHLPQKLPYDRFLEQMLKNNKYRIERTKERIDSYFTLKNLTLDVFQGLASDNSIFPTQNVIGFGLSPIYLENNGNLIFTYFKFPDPELFDFDRYMEALISYCELYLRYGNGASVRYIVDLKNFSLGHIKKTDFVKYRNVLKLFLDGYGFRIAGLDLLNLPVYCQPIVALLKSISSAKMISRIKSYDSLESLQKEIPKNALPKEFGGTADYSLKVIVDISDELLQSQRSFLADSVNYVSNEKLRIGKSKYYDEMFGVDGTFKKINLD